MKKKPHDDPQKLSKAKIDELTARLTAINDQLAPYAAGVNPRELKHIRSEEDMIKKMPFVKKALDLAFEHQELITPEFLEKFWEDYAYYLNVKDIYEMSKKIREQLEQIFPEAVEPYKTEGTTTGV